MCFVDQNMAILIPQRVPANLFFPGCAGFQKNYKRFLSVSPCRQNHPGQSAWSWAPRDSLALLLPEELHTISKPLLAMNTDVWI